MGQHASNAYSSQPIDKAAHAGLRDFGVAAFSSAYRYWKRSYALGHRVRHVKAAILCNKTLRYHALHLLMHERSEPARLLNLAAMCRRQGGTKAAYDFVTKARERRLELESRRILWRLAG